MLEDINGIALKGHDIDDMRINARQDSIDIIAHIRNMENVTLRLKNKLILIVFHKKYMP